MISEPDTAIATLDEAIRVAWDAEHSPLALDLPLSLLAGMLPIERDEPRLATPSGDHALLEAGRILRPGGVLCAAIVQPFSCVE